VLYTWQLAIEKLKFFREKKVDKAIKRTHGDGNMSNQTGSKTLSQALLNLGRIRAIEDPVTFGLLGLYRAQKYNEIDEDEKAEMKLHLKRFKEFCDRFEKIVSYEKNGESKSLERWLTQKSDGEMTSRIDTYVGIYSFLKTPEERMKELDNFKALCTTAHRVIQGNVEPHEVQVSLEKLTMLKIKLNEAFGTEKRISEKILSSRAPFI